MVILTKHGIENEVWWSPIDQNKWPNDRIIEGMNRRFQKSYLFTLTNVIQFFEGDRMVDHYKL